MGVEPQLYFGGFIIEGGSNTAAGDTFRGGSMSCVTWYYSINFAELHMLESELESVVVKGSFGVIG